MIGQQICRNFTAKLFIKTEQEEKEIETVEESTQVIMSFESATDLVNQFLQLFDSSPLKLGNLIKLILIFNKFRNYASNCDNVILLVIKRKPP